MMTINSNRRRLYLFLAVLGLGFALPVATVVGYASHTQSSVDALVASAREIKTSKDAEREIAAWQSRSGEHFWEQSTQLDGDHTYDGHIENKILSRLYLAEPTNVTVGITMKDGNLRSVTVVMFTGRTKTTTKGVWIQEWFDSDSRDTIKVNDKDRPSRATIEFSSPISPTVRNRVFALNSSCFVRLRGCRSAEEILPSIWQLSTPLASTQ
jgi:hypothetical protein